MIINDKINTLSKVEFANDVKQKIADAVSHGKKIKSVTVKMEATHSGKPNGNYWIYTPYGMRAGHRSFVEPVFKPVTKEHREDSKTLGRVIKSEYVKYPDAPDNLERKFDKNYIRDYKQFMSSTEFRDKAFKGLGHVELTAKITDEDSIKRILDGQYGFVSVGGSTRDAHCSICGSSKTKKNSCEHTRGAKYKGETCYYIGDIMDFEHISYVEVPADKNATSTLIRDSLSNQSHLQILDFETEKGETMTIKIEDFDKSNDSLVQHAQKLGLKDYALPSEEGLTILDYVFGEEKTFPIADKASAVVAYDFIKQNIEDSADKEAVIKLIQDKLDELGIDNVDATIEELVKESNKETEVKDSVQPLDVEALANAIVARIQDALVGSTGGSYQAAQNKVLRGELKTVLEEKTQLEAQLRDSLVTQISTVGKITDSARIESYKKRSLVSLQDTLSDMLSAQAEVKSTDEEEITKEKVKDSQEKTLEAGSVSISDSVDGEGTKGAEPEADKAEDTKIEDAQDKVEFANQTMFNNEYLRVLKSEGLQAAKALKKRAVIK